MGQWTWVGFGVAVFFPFVFLFFTMYLFNFIISKFRKISSANFSKQPGIYSDLWFVARINYSLKTLQEISVIHIQLYLKPFTK